MQNESLNSIGIRSARIEIPHILFHYIDFSKKTQLLLIQRRFTSSIFKLDLLIKKAPNLNFFTYLFHRNSSEDAVLLNIKNKFTILELCNTTFIFKFFRNLKAKKRKRKKSKKSKVLKDPVEHPNKGKIKFQNQNKNKNWPRLRKNLHQNHHNFM